MVNQLNIDFNPTKLGQYASLREYLSEEVIPNICAQRGILKKAIAADMDYSPSHFSQKLAGAGDSRFTSDDVEKFCSLYGWGWVVQFYADRATRFETDDDLKQQIKALQAKLDSRND